MSAAHSIHHQCEDIWLRLKSPTRIASLHPLFAQLGFSSDDDIYFLDHPAPHPNWQAVSLIDLELLSGTEEAYVGDESCTAIKLSYSLASLPDSNLAVFIRVASALSEQLDVPMEYCGVLVTRESLDAQLRTCVDDLRRTLGEPGSKEVAVALRAKPRPR